MNDRKQNERYWVGFNVVRGIGPTRLRALLDYFGDVERAWHASAGELRSAGLDRRSLENLLAARPTLDLDRELERIPLGRIATPDDVVGAAIFLLSPASDFITGHNLIIDGGRTVD